MRFGLISAIFTGVAMVGCAASTMAASAAPAAKGARHGAEAHGEAAAAETGPRGLVGLLHADPDRVKGRLGEPAIARAEGKGAFWTYRAPRCALYIFFSDEGEGLKVSGAAAGPRKRGTAYADLDTCLEELEQSRGGPN